MYQYYGQGEVQYYDDYEFEFESMSQLPLFSFQASLDNKEQQSGTVWKLYIDGASRNNPGAAGAGIYIIKNNVPVYKKGFFLGTKTNNQAEYQALIIGLFECKQLIQMDDMVIIYSDSELLVRQMTGQYKVRHELIKPLHELAQHLLVGMNSIFKHVPRAQNSRADLLANSGIDNKVQLSSGCMALFERHGIAI